MTRPPTPHEAYANTLRSSGLQETALGRDWLDASARALAQPLSIALPFHEVGYFPPDKPSAVAYRFTVRRGRRLAIDATFESLGQGRLFVDLFRVDAGSAPEHVSDIPAGTPGPPVEIERDGEYVLRVQPELLRGGRFRVIERTVASLPFPVPSLASRRVQSGFGAERDAGIRQHEGVDIFAAAGTPVVAVTRGVAQPGSNTLGGNVVWLTDASRRHSYYYAHLERSALTATAVVDAGEVLGFVGNTGNARSTAPHLHFGIYSRGAIDPMPFIESDQAVPPAPVIDLPLGDLARVRTRQVDLRHGVTRDAPIASALPQGAVATVLGASGRAVRVALPDGAVGYLPRASLGEATGAVSRRLLAAGATILERPLQAASAVHVVDTPLQVEVIGAFGPYALVRSPVASGWVLSGVAGEDR